MSKNFQVKLPNRGSVTVSGPDARDFLQGLITQDIALLDDQDILYSCLLTPQGKFHHDFFIRKTDDSYILDCEGGDRPRDLADRLSLFKLRSHIKITHDDETPVIAGNGDQPDKAFIDPRHPDLGWRFYGDLDAPDDFDLYDAHRLSLGIPDGSRDLILNKSTIIESRLHHLNAVSFKKGCYMGQELTARMYYRGLAKKHLYPVRVTGTITRGDEIRTKDDKLAGEMRSISGDLGIALLKDDKRDSLGSEPVIPFTCEWMKHDKD